MRRIPGFRSGTPWKQILASLVYLLLIGSCVSVAACGGDEESDSASVATATAARMEASATPVLLATLTAPVKATARPIPTQNALPGNWARR